MVLGGLLLRILLPSVALIAINWLIETRRPDLFSHQLSTILLGIWVLWMSMIAAASVILYRRRNRFDYDLRHPFHFLTSPPSIAFATVSHELIPVLAAILVVPFYFFPVYRFELFALFVLSFAFIEVLSQRLFDPKVQHRFMGLTRAVVAASMVMVFAIPLMMELDKRRGFLLFESCLFSSDGDRLWAYATYVVDCFAKGAIIDLLDSYNINLYHCAPRKGDFINSTTTFVLRSFSTYVVIWLVVQLWKRFRPEKDKSIEN